MGPCLVQPSGRVGVADEVEKPAQQRQAVVTPKPEPSSVPREDIGEGPRIVVCAADGISNDVCHSLGVFLVVQKVCGYPGRSRYRQAAKRDPFLRAKRSLVEAHVRPARLPPCRQRELVPVGGQVAETVCGSGGSVRDDAVFRCPLPYWCLRSELEPGRSKIKMIRWWRPGELVYAMGDAFKNAFRR
jgi:hypothetical protein